MAFSKGKIYKFEVYRQGEQIDFDFSINNLEQPTCNIKTKSKITIINKKRNLKLTYLMEETYIVTSIDSICPELNGYTRLKEKNNLVKKKVKNHILDWNLENRILPANDEIDIFKELEWK